VSVVGTLPLNQKFNLFGRVGYNNVKAEASYMGYSATETVSGTLIGVGAGYNFSEKIVGRVEVQKPASDTSNLSVAVIYKF
jgi:OOP family OmpA-OmpF porin